MYLLDRIQRRPPLFRIRSAFHFRSKNKMYRADLGT
jgi:hypothetical protein